MKAAIHLGPNYVEILEENRNTNFEEIQNLFDITQKLILDHQAEVLNVTPIDWTAPSWTRSTLLRLRLVHGGTVRSFRSESKMENQLKEFRQSNSYRELLGIDRRNPVGFEWNIFPGISPL